MAYPPRNNSLPRGAESGGILLEAVMAATIAITTLAIIAPMFARQLELTRRARDTSLVEAAVNRDINSYRQWARIWKMGRGPFSTSYSKMSTLSPNYQQSQGGASKYALINGVVPNACATRRTFILEFLDDARSADARKANPDLVKNFDTLTIPSALKGRYILSRTYYLPPSTTQSDVLTLRLDYKVEPDPKSDPKAEPLAFQRSAEIQIEAADAC